MSFSKCKRINRVIAASRKLFDDGLDFELWVVGDGPERKELEHQTRILNLNERVRFLGLQTNPYYFMRQGDIFVCSSLYEGFNLTVLEALAVGLPVVSTNCTGPTEILAGGKYGLIVENSTEGLFDGLSIMIKNENVRKKYSDQARKRAMCFDENGSIGKCLERVFNF